MGDCLPLARHIWNWERCVTPNVESNVLRSHPELCWARVNIYLACILQYLTLTLSAPFLGWSPRPRNKPGGSTLKFPTFSLRPSRRQVVYLASNSSLAFFAAFFSSEVMAFFFAFSASKYSYMGWKSQSSKLVIFVPSLWSFKFNQLMGSCHWKTCCNALGDAFSWLFSNRQRSSY